MVNQIFCLIALVLFSIGFRLVKRGSPYARTGGDNYTKRRMRRMLGWMMWTTAAVLLLLALLNTAYTGAPSASEVAQSGVTPPSTARDPDINTRQRIVPNLLVAPALQADTGTDSHATHASTGSAAPALTFSSLEEHRQSITPNLMVPSANDSATVDPGTGDLAAKPPLDQVVAAADAAPPAAPAGPGVASPTADQKQMNDVVAAASATLERDPTNLGAFIQRGYAYTAQSQWDLARTDFQHALRIESTCKPAMFGLAELDFQQGRYDDAKRSFIDLEQDSDFGDLAKYKAFLCDLFGGHEDTASRELAVFNQVGSEASYYFANVAWFLYHKKAYDAKSWWDSATQIFAPEKINLYAKPLIVRGYIKVS